MSTIYTEISLKNAFDVEKAEEGIITEQEIRQTTVKALVDTGAWTLVINEKVREKLGLKIKGTDWATLADGKRETFNLTAPIEVIWKDRRAICTALVLPNADEVLLGAIPLETLDLMIHPRTETLVGAHGDQPVHRV